MSDRKSFGENFLYNLTGHFDPAAAGRAVTVAGYSLLLSIEDGEDQGATFELPRGSWEDLAFSSNLPTERAFAAVVKALLDRGLVRLGDVSPTGVQLNLTGAGYEAARHARQRYLSH